jgi:hypothetical protein
MSALASGPFQGAFVLLLRGVLMTALAIAAVAPAMPAQIAEHGNSPAADSSALGSPDSPRKSGTIATLLAVVVPGSGHIYAGETGKGLALFAGTVSAAVIGYSYSKSKCPSSSNDNCDVTPMVAADVVALGLWVYGVFDAHNATRHANLYVDARNGATLVGLRVAVR